MTPLRGWSGSCGRMPRLQPQHEHERVENDQDDQHAPRARCRRPQLVAQVNDSTRITSANGRKNSATERRASTTSRTYRRTGPRSRGGRLRSSPARSAVHLVGPLLALLLAHRAVGLLAGLRRGRRAAPPLLGLAALRGRSALAAGLGLAGLDGGRLLSGGRLASSEHGRQRTCGVGAGQAPGEGGNFLAGAGVPRRCSRF